MDSISCSSANDSSDCEDGRTLQDLYVEAGLDIDVGESEKELLKEKKVALANILGAVVAARKGYELLAKCATLLETAVMNSPDIGFLSNMLVLTKKFEGEKRPVKSMPQKSVNFHMHKPKYLGKGSYACKLCPELRKCWASMDSHIRSEHSKVFYGPCSNKCPFTSPNIDSFRRHTRCCSVKS